MSKTSLLGDKPVNRIGFGAMQLAGPGVFGPPRDPDGARAVLRRAIELGVNHIDTSQFYGPNVVNELIRETLHPYPEDLRLVSKLGARRDDKGGWLVWDDPAGLRQGLEDNLRTLQIERLDAVNLRLMDEHDSEGKLEEQLGTLADLRSEGKLDMIGISNASTETLRRAMDLVQIACVQNPFSVVNREGESELELCEERGVAYVPFFPLGSAFSGGPKQLAADPAVAEVAAKHGATPSQVALAWLLHRSERILLIPGTSSIGHLEENMTAGEIELDARDMARLDEAEQLGDPLAAAEQH
ncbi:MAG TPA: oxidoreductase [Solirubrobacteraceae bacterium]|jgi:aryl-alcohol dehydrogenase-like predicted oxidoreductase|nr:oxidoreductase [Solirubrobacteraceae bacterium]